MSLPAYAEYKDSQILGIHHIPSHWFVTKIKFLFEIGRGRVIAQEELIDNGLYPVYSSQTLDNGCLGFIDTFDFDCDQITWTTDGANAGTVFLREGKHNCTNVCGTLKARNKSYLLKYYLYSLQYLTQFYKRPDTNGAKIMNGEMAEIIVTQPSLPEQTTIARFLDHETAKIDALIAEQQRLIELLKEKRQAVISHAVTKGLDPNAPMKDSGVAWLGDVPEHWEVKRFRFVVEINPSKQEITKDQKLRSLNANSEVSFLPMDAVGDDGTLRLDQLKPISLVEAGYSYFKEGDVTIAKITPCFENGKGAVMKGLFNGIGFGSTELIVVRPKKIAISDYIHWVFISHYFRLLGEGWMYGAGGQKRVPDDFVREFGIGLPSLDEQIQVSKFLDQQTAKMDELISHAHQGIDLLKERRSALISAAVTGKIDVRGWQPPATAATTPQGQQQTLFDD